MTVPALASCPLSGQSHTKTYPVQELKGAIFVYFGDALHQQAPKLRVPTELTDADRYEALLCTAKWHCNYRYAIDNVMDPMHGAYLHAQSHSMARGDKQAVMRVRHTEHGLVCEKETSKRGQF